MGRELMNLDQRMRVDQENAKFLEAHGWEEFSKIKIRPDHPPGYEQRGIFPSRKEAYAYFKQYVPTAKAFITGSPKTPKVFVKF